MFQEKIGGRAGFVLVYFINIVAFVSHEGLANKMDATHKDTFSRRCMKKADKSCDFTRAKNKEFSF